MVIISDTDYKGIDLIKINQIDDLRSISIKPDILNITHINNKKDYKSLLKYLKTIKGKILIVNDKDKYLKRIFLRYLDIYRYGNNIYDDIEYIKKKDKIIFKYDSKKYEINILDEKIFGYIIIKLLQNNNIKEVISILEKNN